MSRCAEGWRKLRPEEPVLTRPWAGTQPILPPSTKSDITLLWKRNPTPLAIKEVYRRGKTKGWK